MTLFRRFKNTDPPALAEVWNEAHTARGAYPLRTPALLELLRSFGPLRLIVFAALLTLSVIFLPNGLVSLLARRMPNRRPDSMNKMPGEAT